jgi:succinoglycan biosynthesis protein ExoO
MANHNGAAHLTDAIESVQKQSLHELEIIVSDDASSDDSVSIVSGLMAKDPRIRLVRSDRNGGPAAARNRALAVAKGDWIAVMDSDDLMHPERLAKLFEAARCECADMVADDLVEFHTNSSRPPRRLLTGRWARGPFWVDILDYIRLNHFYGPGPALGYLKPIFRASILIGPTARYDETLKIAEDYNLVLRLLHAGRSMRVYPFPLYFYRKHDASISHRLNESVLEALKTADLQFLDEISRTDGRLIAAIDERLKSIETAVAYQGLLHALKGKDWLGAIGIAATNPQAVALLRLPLGVRLRRLVRARLHRTSAVHALTPQANTSSRDRQSNAYRTPADLS